jgi:TolB protein
VTKESLWIVERDGKKTRLPIERSRGLLSPRFSPDGKQLLYTTYEHSYVQWVYDLQSGTLRRFSEENVVQCWGVWTLDGADIVYNMHRNEDPSSQFDLFRRPIDWSSAPEQLTRTKDLLVPSCISPDGAHLIYTQFNKREGKDQKQVMEVALTGSHEIRTLLKSPGIIGQAVISPDGRWMAYVLDQSESWEVYVQPYHAIGKAVQVSRGGGFGPLWSPDGKELFFVSGDTMKATPVDRIQGPIVSKPKALFRFNPEYASGYGRTFDISPDGKRFVVVEGEEPPPPAKEIVVVVNWFEELKKKMSQYAK